MAGSTLTWHGLAWPRELCSLYVRHGGAPVGSPTMFGGRLIMHVLLWVAGHVVGKVVSSPCLLGHYRTVHTYILHAYIDRSWGQGRRHRSLRLSDQNRQQCGQLTPKIGKEDLDLGFLGHFIVESGGRPLLTFSLRWTLPPSPSASDVRAEGRNITSL